MKRPFRTSTLRVGLAAASAMSLSLAGGVQAVLAGSPPAGMFSATPVPSAFSNQPFVTCMIGLEGTSSTSSTPAPEDWYIRSAATGPLQVDLYAVTVNSGDTSPSGGVVATLYDGATQVAQNTAAFPPGNGSGPPAMSTPSAITDASAVVGGVYRLEVALEANSSEQHYQLGFSNNTSRPDVGIESPSFSNFEPTSGYTFYLNAAAGQTSLYFTVDLPGGNGPSGSESNFNVTVTDTVTGTALLTATNQPLPYNATVSSIPTMSNGNPIPAHALRVDVSQAPIQPAQLTSPLTASMTYTSLSVTPLPAAVNSGDNLIIAAGHTPSQTVTAAAPAAAGASSITVNSFVANANYGVGTAVFDSAANPDGHFRFEITDSSGNAISTGDPGIYMDSCPPQGGGNGNGGGPGGPNVFANLARYDTIDVGDDTTSVLAGDTFPGTPGCFDSAGGSTPFGYQDGCRNWQFQMVNQGSADLTGAQVAVTTTPPAGPTLSDSSQFDFQYTEQNGGFGGSPSLTPCHAAPSASQETCPTPGVTLSGSGGSLNVTTSMDPQFGVPVSGMTTGYDSARTVLPPGTAGAPSGISQVLVPVTLRDTSRFGTGPSNALEIDSFNSNVVPNSGTIIGPGGVLPVCSFPGGGSTACAVQPQYQACTNTFCSPGQVCNAVHMGVQNAQVGATYSIDFQEYVANTTSLTTGNCGAVKTALRIGASPMGSPQPAACCSATVTDPTLGNVTFSIDSGQATTFQTKVTPNYVVQYTEEAQIQVVTNSIQATEGATSFDGITCPSFLNVSPCPVALFAEGHDSSAPPGDVPATINWGDGHTTSGTVGTASVPGFGTLYTVSGAHTYADEGTYTVTVSVADVDTAWNTASASATATVADAHLAGTGNQTFNTTYPVSNARVATFSDANPSATCADFNGTDLGPNGTTPGSITVTWGGVTSTSGTTTAGTCALLSRSSSTSVFTVSTGNAAAQPGLHSVTIHITDDGGQTLTLTNILDIATDAGSIGYWKGSNGQSIITSGASTHGTCNSATWLRGYNPFQDLNKGASCTTVAAYVSSVMSVAIASGASENAMLKAQMLATALDVYFSDPALGGNKLNAPLPIGSLDIDLAGICSTTDGSAGSATCSGSFNSLSGEQSAFGTASHCITVAAMLAYQNTVSNSGGTIWYGNVKSTQVLAKDAFDVIDNQLAYTC